MQVLVLIMMIPAAGVLGMAATFAYRILCFFVLGLSISVFENEDTLFFTMSGIAFVVMFMIFFVLPERTHRSSGSSDPSGMSGKNRTYDTGGNHTGYVDKD